MMVQKAQARDQLLQHPTSELLPRMQSTDFDELQLNSTSRYLGIHQTSAALPHQNPPVVASGMAARSKLRTLAQYSACDISDALLKLKVPGAGFLADLKHFAPNGITSDKLCLLPKIISPASTVLLVPKHAQPNEDESVFQGILESNIPYNHHFADMTKPDTFVVMNQPPSQTCAVLGGILASRMKVLGAKGVAVGGRIRDQTELKKLHMPIWAAATSTVGTGMESRAWAVEVPITVQGLVIHPGDFIFSDPIEGLVVIPQAKLDAVLEIIPKLTKADEKVRAEVELGMPVKEAFAKFRGA